MMNFAEQEVAWKKKLEQFKTDNETETDNGIVFDFVTYYPTGAVLLEDGSPNRMQDPAEGSMERLKNQHFYWSTKLKEAAAAFYELKRAAENQIVQFGRVVCEPELQARQKVARRLKRKVNRIEEAINNHPDTIAAAEQETKKEQQREKARNRLNKFRI